ncbi:MAG: phosphoribosylanthranilate isomerase, partial [Prevotella sp.]|nr:phosphoribosylanthranilate isomerase [Prevotella sp.]
FLFDTRSTFAGGSGEKFDWSILRRYAGGTPFLLSGGIGPADAERITRFRHPQFIGIDINSCFETAPAVKDISKLKDFFNIIRN